MEEIINVERFLRYCKISKGLVEETTVNQYRTDIYEFCEILGIKDNEGLKNLTNDQIENYLEYLYNKNYSVRSYNKKLSTMKSLYNYLELEDYITKNLFRKYETKKIKPEPKRYLTYEEGYRLVKSTKNDRDELIIKFYLSTGVRVSELTSIKLGDIIWETNEILIRRKGGKKQKIVIPTSIMEDTKIYLDRYRKKQLEALNLTDENMPYLFVSFRGNKLHTNCLNGMIKTTAKNAGIKDWDKIHNHTMRTTFATQMHRDGVSDKAIQIQLGHSNIATTLNSYVQMDNDRVRDEMSNRGINFGFDVKPSDYDKKIKQVVETITEGEEKKW